MRHIVNKLEFETVCSDESLAFEVRHNLSRVCQDYAADILEKIFSKYVTGNEWIQIEKLEIDLGHMNPVAFESNFKTALYANFEKEFLSRLNSLPGSHRVISKQLSRYELLVFFLRQGILPWWADDSSFDPDELFHEVLDEQEILVYHFLQDNRLDDVIWQRIAWQFSPEVIARIINLFDKLVTAERKMLQWSDTWLMKRATAFSTADREMLIVEIRKFIGRKATVLLNQAAETNAIVFSSLCKEFAKEICSRNSIVAAPGTETGFADVMTNENRVTSPDFFQDDISSVVVTKDPIPGGTSFAMMKKENDKPVEKFVVRHAGVVLFYPFLRMLFAESGLWEADEWKEKISQHRAVHMLRYLGTGQQMSPEYNLGLEKILCGIRPGEPVSRDIVLTEKEIKEAEALLLSVIDHWKVLKNSSVHAMRETFIKRDGIVTLKDNEWLLQVERKTEDVLLESIPWGYSTIHLPWNGYIIHVEW